MNKTKLLKHLFLLFALIVGSTSAWADDVLVYTLDGTVTTGGNSNYAQDGGGLTQGDLSWSVTGNTTISPWRIGGKNLNNVNREVYTKTPMPSAITKVELELGNKTLTVNSITFIVASDASFTNEIYSKTETNNTSNTTLTFSPTSPNTEWATGSYYKFVFNVTAGSSNSYVQLNSVKFYKNEASAGPSISANNVDIEHDATSGSIEYTLNNEVAGGQLSASVTAGDWLTLGNSTASPIPFTCSANTTAAARTATVTLTYTYNTTETVTKTVTVTQAAAPVVISTIPALFEAATSTATDVAVTFNNWVVSGVSTNGKNVFVTDGTNGFVIFDNAGGLGSTYAVGNVLSGTGVSCKLQLYNGFAEITNLNAADLTISTGGTVSAANIAMANLAGINTGALVSYKNLTCSVSSNKYYLTDGTTTLQVYNTLYAFGSLEDGKTYNITGIYQQYNSTKEILPRSANDIVEVVSTEPQIVAEDVEIAYSATSGEIPVTIVNPVDNASFGAGTFDTPWITNVNAVKIDATHYKVTFNTEANTGDERSATITINYNGVNKDVTVTQTAAPVVSGSEINSVDAITLEADATSGEIAYTITNPVTGTALTAEVSTDVDWISNIVVTDEKVTFTVTPNEYADKRMTVMYLYYGSARKNVTINQKAYIPQGEDVANLPFEFDYGVNAVAPYDGLSQDGLGSDYSSSPYLKFDSTGDWLLLHFNERPGTLTFDIKGNTFSGGTFKVQTSVDGTTFTDLKAYTELGAVQNEQFDNLASDVRYIKWIYSEKVSGNVALGNIKLDQYDGTPSITVTPEVVNVTAAETEGTLTVTYKFVDSDLAEVKFCNANGGDAEYDWVDAEIDNDNNVYYIVYENTGEARTAYLKVYGLDAESNNVYSNIVTITQAAPVAESNRYEKVTSTEDITDGQYLIVYEDANLAFDGGLETLDGVGNSIDVEIADDMIAATSATRAAEFTIDVTAGTLMSASGLYIGVTSNSNGLKQDEDATKYTNAFSIDEAGNAVIAAVFDGSTMTLRYNSADNQTRFRYYKSGQQAIQLYKYIPVTVPATVTSYKWATLSSEYDMDFSTLTDVEAYIVTDAEGSSIKTQKVNGTVAANTGLLLYSETPIDIEIPIAAEAGTDYSNSNKLIAVTKKTTVNKADDGTTNYVLAVQGGKAVFAYINNTPAILKKGQAYLNLEGEELAPYLGFDGDGTTSLREMRNEELEMRNAQFYDLSGRRVENPTNGVYIVNGKKVVIK